MGARTCEITFFAYDLATGSYLIVGLTYNDDGTFHGGIFNTYFPP